MSARLTRHQQDVLAIVASGRESGVAVTSVVREQRADGRLAADVMRTVWSLRDRGLITIGCERSQRIGPHGVYLHEVRVARLVEQEQGR